LPHIPDKLLDLIPGFPPFMAQILFNRGLMDAAQLQSFITADRSLSADPFLLPGMHQAVSRIYRALLSGETIAIYGDFDADGITATAVLVKGLSALDGKVIPYIPHRVTEGHGLKTTALERLRRQGVTLVITVDCGITGVSEVRKARRAGPDIVITDHHTPPDEIPQAFAVVDPRLAESSYPFPDLAGVGVAYKLLQALYLSIGREEQIDELTDLVALGTVADMMPLLGENRYLVKRGLEIINKSPRLGILEVLKQAGVTPGNITSENISWIIAPRINTASRLDHALPSYELMMTDSPDRAQTLASWLEKKNTERQKITTSATEKARQQVIADGISPLLMVGDAGYPAGIAGLVASRLADEFYRPSVVIRTGNRTSSGSCRSIPEFNIIQALNHCGHLFTQFGGHAQAAGFIIPTGNLSELRKCLMQLATVQLADVDLRPRVDIDVEVRLPDIAGDAFETMQQLAPFGQGNPSPVFITRHVDVDNCRIMGNDGGHLRFSLRQDDMLWDAVGFGMGASFNETNSPIDIVYNLEIDRWGGEERLRLNLIDFAPAE